MTAETTPVFFAEMAAMAHAAMDLAEAIEARVENCSAQNRVAIAYSAFCNSRPAAFESEDLSTEELARLVILFAVWLRASMPELSEELAEHIVAHTPTPENILHSHQCFHKLRTVGANCLLNGATQSIMSEGTASYSKQVALILRSFSDSTLLTIPQHCR